MVQWFKDAEAIPDLGYYNLHDGNNRFVCAVGIVVDHHFDGDAADYNQDEMVYMLAGVDLGFTLSASREAIHLAEAEWFEQGAMRARDDLERDYGLTLAKRLDDMSSERPRSRTAFTAGYRGWSAVIAAVRAGVLPDKDDDRTYPSASR